MIVSSLACSAARGDASKQRDFDGIRCGADVASALVGRKSRNEPVAATEKRYAAIGLKDLGGDTVTDEGLSLITWKICGHVFLVLYDRDAIGDAVQLPPVGDDAAPLATECKRQGRVVAHVLPLWSGDAIEKAWRVDVKKKKILPEEPKGLECPRGNR
jgi:hypothetical protein